MAQSIIINHHSTKKDSTDSSGNNDEKSSIGDSPSLSSSNNNNNMIDSSSSSSYLLSDKSMIINKEDLLKPGILNEMKLQETYMTEKEIENNTPAFSWCNINANTFNVRSGPDYLINGQKKASNVSLYNTFNVDCYRISNKINNITQFIDVTKKIELFHKKYENNGKVFSLLPPILMINFMIPNYSPGGIFYGNDNTDGDGYSIVFYSELSQYTLDYLIKYSKNLITFDQLPASIKLLSKFIKAAQTRNDNNMPNSNNLNADNMSKDEIESLLSKFKCIIRLMNYNFTNLSYSVLPMIKQYNSKPFICKTSTKYYYQHLKYFSIDIDSHIFGKLARKSLYMIKNSINTMIFDAGFVIEGTSNEELPEQILTCSRVSKIGEKNAKQFPKHLLNNYLKRKNDNLHTLYLYDVNAQYAQCTNINVKKDKNNDYNNNNNNNKNNNNNDTEKIKNSKNNV